MSRHDPIDPADGIEPGRRLIRAERAGTGAFGPALRDRLRSLASHLSPSARATGPLQLLAAFDDPIAGDVRAGKALLAGKFRWRGASLPLETLRFDDPRPGLAEHLHGFGWLRDLSTVATRQQGAPVAEALVRRWLAGHARDDQGLPWRADIAGRRALAWIAHAPLVLSTRDKGYRLQVLTALSRQAQRPDQARPGLPRLAAWSGAVAASLLMAGYAMRRATAEAGLVRALSRLVGDDGGTADRSPESLLDAVALLTSLRAAYDAAGEEPPLALQATLARAVPALLGATHGDGGLASWQGGLPLDRAQLAAVIDASGVRARPLRQARGWGYQRLSGGATVVTVDAAPPPPRPLGAGGCASTLAFELSDGAHRIVVSCGGARHEGAALSSQLAQALRATAAHSTLVVGDANSTAVLPDGALGRGVSEVAVDRHELEGGSRLDVSHDGYVRRFGLTHRRTLALSVDGRELRGEDALLPAGRSTTRAAPFAIRFHLGPAVEGTVTADGQGALLRTGSGPVWQFRCKGGVLAVEDSLWIDPTGRPRATQQLVVSGESSPAGLRVSWMLTKAG